MKHTVFFRQCTRALPLVVVLLILWAAMNVGETRLNLLEKQREQQRQEQELVDIPEKMVPDRGTVNILNGCGAVGVAGSFEEYLRENMFKAESDNARSWNYRRTMVISRRPGTKTAQEIADLLNTDDPVFIRPATRDSRYDATVIIGHDYERILYDRRKNSQG
ncbi:MAG: LytR C-terminal domain-containing protein [Fibrobacterota bacterium]